MNADRRAARPPLRAGPWAAPVLTLLALLLVLTYLYPGAVLRGEIFASADAESYNAFAVVGDRSLAAGTYPLWNPYLFAGMPTFGSLSYVKYVYPPSFLFAFLQNQLGFPPLTWLLVHLLFGGLGVAYLLRCWRLPVAAQVLGAVVWILLPKVVAWGVHGHGSKLIAAMYLPWIVAWGWQVLQGRGARAVAWTGLLIGLQFLRGHVQISYYTLLTLGWLAVGYAVWKPRISWRRLAGLASAVALGFLIGAILLVPVRQYAALSIRGQDVAGGGGVGYEYASGWSLAPAELPTLVLPGQAGFGKATYMGYMPFTDYPNYFGLLLLILAGLAWRSGRSRDVILLGALALLAVLIALGNHGPGVHRLLYQVLPFFNKFRVPSMILILTGFAVALLAALGAQSLAAAAPDRTDRLRRLIPLAMGVFGVAILLAGATGAVESAYRGSLQSLASETGKSAHPDLLTRAWTLHRADLIRIGLVLMTAAAALWLATRNVGFRSRGLIWVLAVLIVMDLAAVDRKIANPEHSLLTVALDGGGQPVLVPAAAPGRQPPPRGRDDATDPATVAMRDAVGHDRVWPLGNAGRDNRFMTAGIRSLGGYHPAKLAAFEQIRQRIYDREHPAGRIAGWLGGRVVALDGPLPARAFDLLRDFGLDLDPQPVHGGTPTLYTNRAALPRARLVDAFVLADTLPQSGDLGSFLDDIQTGRHRFDYQIVLDSPPDPLPAAGAGPLPPVEFVADDLDRVVVRTSAASAALLLLADMYAPGWQVTVDGERRPLLRADLCLRAVALSAGRHEVSFQYHDPAVRTGLTLSLLGLAGVVALMILPWIRRRGGQQVQNNEAAAELPPGGTA